MANCPNCNHNPSGLSSSWMWIYKCGSCGKEFCHVCGTTSYGNTVKCPCGSSNTKQVRKCHG